MIQLNLSCHKCGHHWQIEPPIARREECPICKSDAKCCLNCRWYDPSAHHECREEQAEWVKEKPQGNFCSWFEPNAGPSARAQEQAKARSKLDALFGGPKPGAAPSKPGESLGDELKRFLAAKK